jgi:hypothetical protein
VTKLPGSRDDTTPIFGLTKDQLRPIIDNIVGDDKVISFDVTIEHRIQGFYGYSADKVVPTFTYTTQSSRIGTTTVFVKRFHRSGPAEAHQYTCLQKHSAPIPRMYGVMTDPNGREMLFLEYLAPIGDVQACEKFLNDLDQFRQLLAATAHFNSIHPSGEYAAQLPRKDVGKGLIDACATLERIWEHTCKGDLGDALKQLCSGSRSKLHQLQEYAVGLVEPIAQMEIGLIHSDIYPENTGWRQGQERQLLILDLEWIGFGPRFYDAASLLGAPDDLQPHCQRRDGLAYYYMEQYVRWGGTAEPLDRFMKEAAILWTAQTLNIMWFGLRHALDGRVDWTEDREEGRRFFRDGLHRDLSVLLRVV